MAEWAEWLSEWNTESIGVVLLQRPTGCSASASCVSPPPYSKSLYCASQPVVRVSACNACLSLNCVSAPVLRVSACAVAQIGVTPCINTFQAAGQSPAAAAAAHSVCCSMACSLPRSLNRWNHVVLRWGEGQLPQGATFPHWPLNELRSSLRFCMMRLIITISASAI